MLYDVRCIGIMCANVDGDHRAKHCEQKVLVWLVALRCSIGGSCFLVDGVLPPLIHHKYIDLISMRSNLYGGVYVFHFANTNMECISSRKWSYIFLLR